MNEQERQDAERLRQEHEAERERRELLRRIGEGGPEQHVPGNVLPGRVEAEEERVAAEEQRKSWRKFYVRLASMVALPIAFIALIPSAISFYLVEQKIVDNRALIHAHQHLAYDICTGLEKVKSDNRDAARMSYNNLDRTLRILGLERTQEVERIARENLEASLRRNAPIEGGCPLPPGGIHD